MLDSHKKFHSADGKRLLLVADDEFINRELLKAMLSDDYNVITCEDGLEALEKTRENSSMLSLVILDLQMPGMSGMEVLTKIRED